MKKIIFLFIFLLATTNAMATTYYVATDGSGDYTTIAQVNAATFVAGDEVLFKRGDTFRGQLIPDSGSASGYITYGAYGTGAKPLILGSKQENALTDWTDLGGNIWSNNDASFTVDVGNIIFDNEASCGIKVQAEAGLDAQDKFWYDFTNDMIKVYSIGNPASVHTNIECALTKDIIDGSPDYVIIENLDIRYGGRHGVGFSPGTSDIIIRDCDFSFIGGGDGLGTYTVRLGNAIEVGGGVNNILVERCSISDIYDAGITSQGNGTYTNDNVVFSNNLINKCEFSIENWDRGENTKISNIFYIHNTCLNAGYGWGHNQRWDSQNGRHLMLYWNSATMLNKVIIKNNIFDTATESGVWIYTSGDSIDYDIDNNIWNCTVVGRYANTNYITLSAYQSATGQDTHSIAADPLLSSRYRLKPGSPAINAGVDVDVDTDYLGNPRDNSPDIGAMESGDFLNNATLRNATFN